MSAYFTMLASTVDKYSNKKMRGVLYGKTAAVLNISVNW